MPIHPIGRTGESDRDGTDSPPQNRADMFTNHLFGGMTEQEIDIEIADELAA
ncbi:MULTISPECIES: hypothetical protein [unclassified Rhodococcus (in: high G+C Gram-positive bacteria)]|uniref:hypothetical protein n=1 Tax=unclassified Rhodococcus (in: high G+C Gram-positive bacteria) TaxID=192944 RepID=UPI00163B1270|nr:MULTISPECIES: hypothetical protein [unclassified Rhodococcus (in: high G+C Gram-positive bacteria)]MBC2639110.1 hypothetical protein [Rhodococcus sp. 3A]MBC2896148.1 hypothetical protein [Rhodococcus sp. 4CII]